MLPPVLAVLLALPVILPAEPAAPVLRITLDPADPAASRAQLHAPAGDPIFSFPVGFGLHGLLPPGSRFLPGHSLLGSFRISAVLTADRFEMDDALIARSGKSRAWLARHLFANMSSLDFDGDGRGGEYGTAYIALEPLPSTSPQPFGFQTYRGVFRWYGYALHGTQDDTRVGRPITGGCVNASNAALVRILPHLRLGDLVQVVQP